MITLFLDFAETLGFRSKLEIETDLEIVRKHTNLSVEEINEEYRLFCQTSGNVYDRSLTFKNYEEEFKFVTKHFYTFLLPYLGRRSSDGKSKLIADEKFNTLSHKLFPDVVPALEEYQKLAEMYVLSDGRPSREKTLELLGLKKYCRDFFISDCLGFVKTEASFYEAVLKQICVQQEACFIDDITVNIDTLNDVLKAKGILIDRKYKINPGESKYHVIHKLPVNLLS